MWWLQAKDKTPIVLLFVNSFIPPINIFSSVQFSSVAQSCPTLCDPMNRNMPGLPVHHQLPEFTQTHWKRLWCWEGLEAGGEGDDRGWDGWMASATQWTWVWVNSGSWWWTGRPGVLHFTESQRVGHDWSTELNWTELNWTECLTIQVWRSVNTPKFLGFLLIPPKRISVCSIICQFPGYSLSAGSFPHL